MGATYSSRIEDLPYPPTSEHLLQQRTLGFGMSLLEAAVDLSARVGPCGVLMDLTVHPTPDGCSCVARPERVSADAHCDHADLASRGGRWGSGWSMVPGCPPHLAPAGDPFVRIRTAALELIDRQADWWGYGPGDVTLREHPEAVGLHRLDQALRMIAEQALAELDENLVRLARRVHPSARWWLYEVATIVEREDGAEGVRNLAQAVECIPGVVLLAFALDDPHTPGFNAVTSVLEDLAWGSRRAPELAADLVDAWWQGRESCLRHAGRPGRRRRVRRGWQTIMDEPEPVCPRCVPTHLADDAARREQVRLVLRASRKVDPKLLLVPAPPGWAPEDVPADPWACARWFAVVQGARADWTFGAVARVAERVEGTWSPTFGAFVSAHAAALWHRDRNRIGERVAAVEAWAGAAGRRPGRASNPVRLMEEAAAMERFLRCHGPRSARRLGPSARASFSVPASFSYEGPGLRVEPVRTALDLLAEAARLRNCLGDYVTDCAKGTYAVCRAQVDGRPWVIGMRRHRWVWVLEQVAGPRNGRMPRRVFDALRPFFDAAGVVVPPPDRNGRHAVYGLEGGHRHAGHAALRMRIAECIAEAAGELRDRRRRGEGLDGAAAEALLRERIDRVLADQADAPRPPRAPQHRRRARAAEEHEAGDEQEDAGGFGPLEAHPWPLKLDPEAWLASSRLTRDAGPEAGSGGPRRSEDDELGHGEPGEGARR